MGLENGLLGLKNVPVNDIAEIILKAQKWKQNLLIGSKQHDILKGKSVVTLFYENSTRTRLSFELAGKYLGGVVANIATASSSVAKGESLRDTGKTIEMMGVDAIVIRHPCSGAPHYLARHVNIPVINAGDGMNEHPTQALLDMLTIQQHFGTLTGIKVAIIGDILHSRVARSNIWGLTKMGANVCIAGPATLIPNMFETKGLYVCPNIRDAVKDAQVVMALRVQTERQTNGLFPSVSEYSQLYGLRLDWLPPSGTYIVLHPGPMNRGVELNSLVADSPESCISLQVLHGVSVRMAILQKIVGGE